MELAHPNSLPCIPISALNAFLGLRSRYKDWRATQNKEEFYGRLSEMVSILEIAGEYHDDPDDFFLRVVQDSTEMAKYFIFGMMTFVAGYVFSMTPFFYDCLSFAISYSGLLYGCTSYFYIFESLNHTS